MNKIKLAIVFTVLIDVIGIGVVIPVLPYYVESFGARPLLVTLLFSVFAVCSLISAPFLGSLSDRIGRRPVLITSILSTSIGWFVFAAAPNIFFLFLGRIIDGMAAGNISTAQNYLVDIAKDQKERATNLGLIGASFGIGFVIGPLLGGVLSSVSQAFPFYFVGALAMLNVILAYFFLPETHFNRSQDKKIELNPLTPLIRASKSVQLRPNYLVWFLFILAISSMQAVFALYVGDVFGFNPFQAGIFFTLHGVVVAFNQGVALKRFWLKFFQPTSLEFWLLPIGALSFAFLSVPWLWVFVLGQVILALTQSVLRVVMTSQVISNVDPASQGETLGIMNSIVSLGMIVAPLIAGLLYEKSYTWPFYLSTLLMLVASAYVWRRRRSLSSLKPIVEDEVTTV